MVLRAIKYAEPCLTNYIPAKGLSYQSFNKYFLDNWK